MAMRNVLVARAERFSRLLITMEPGAKFRFTFLYSLAGEYRSVSADLPRQVAGDLLITITEALQDGVPVQDSTPAVADEKAHGVWVAELIKERDELRDQNKELLDQVQCLQWDLNALAAQHDLCPQPAPARRR
ncbi:hypothetical protein OHB26_21010 [Nocardia sp. NBC_01503]|uniref:hypothetical protein n=1 Tax=Nocardia sp. NBC_01503 TaxID=2975997 RepID=UPI002E7AE986|nr:hypothetical protein [Nocardia sp. NBC_01503]WTL29480.1 hypothetical protein OHB26_21010 [Nocardia sp. NBC_01503]